VCQDGYFVSHIPGPVELAEPGQVESFLPPFNPKYKLDPHHPVLMGPQCRADQGAAIERGRAEAMLRARNAIPEIIAEFNRTFGRNYSPFLEEYLTDDAEVVFFGQGAHTVPARLAAEKLRQEGLKVGVVQLRFMRPFPTEEVAQTLSRFKVVGVLENSNSFGAVHDSGPVTVETLAALYYAPRQPKVLTFFGGLGGENIRLSDYYQMAQAMKDAVTAERLAKRVFWLGFDPLDVTKTGGQQ